MKNRRAVMILTMLFVGIPIVSGSRHSVHAQPYGKSHASREHDALLKLLTTNGKRPFDKLVNNGFKVSYKIRGKAVTASVIGNKLSYLRTKKIERDGLSAMVTEVTKDGALEITTYFFLDEAKQKLTIDRRIRNTSPETVSLKTMREYVDPKLVFRTQSTRKRGNLGQTVVERIRAGQFISAVPAKGTVQGVVDRSSGGAGRVDSGDCHCPDPPPPCMTIICPPDPSYVSAKLITSAAKRITLHWKGATILASLKQDRMGTLSVNEARFITQVNIR